MYPVEAMTELDGKMQARSTEILSLQREADRSYQDLMAKYDVAVPYILEKYF